MDLHRRQAIERALHTPEGASVAGLAASHGVSIRTIYRDLRELRRLGAEVHYDPGSRHQRSLGPWVLDRPQLGAQEREALLVAMGLLRLHAPGLVEAMGRVLGYLGMVAS